MILGESQCIQMKYTEQNNDGMWKRAKVSVGRNGSFNNDGIPIRFLKLTKVISAKVICHIINLTIKHSKIPIAWSVTPLFRDGDYRPTTDTFPSCQQYLRSLNESSINSYQYTYLYHRYVQIRAI